MNENITPEFSNPAPETPQIPQMQPTESVEENLLGGIVGAFLFSLAGGIVWFLLYQIGYLAAISGIIGVVCAIKGYAVFGKRESTKGIIISTVIAFLVIVLAWYCCLSYDLFTAHKEWYASGELDYTVTFFDCVTNSYKLLEDTEIAAAYLKDLAIGLLFCVVGAFGYVKSAIGKSINS